MKETLLSLTILLVLLNINSASAWEFAVHGDTRSGHDNHMDVVAGIIGKMPNNERVTILNTGDITLEGTDDQWQTWQGIVGPFDIDWNKEYPPGYIGAVGNHDDGSDGWLGRWVQYLPAQVGLSAYTDITAHSEGRFGSVKYDNTIFVWVDSTSSSLSGQDSFLEGTLQKAAQDPDVIWKFVFFHHPPIPCSDRSDWAKGKEWHDDYFVPYGVDVVFLGHDHHYIRTCPITDASTKSCDEDNRGNVIGDSAGVVHIITGGGGAGLYDTRCTSPCGECPCLEKGAKYHHFLEIDVQPNQLNINTWETDSAEPTLIDELTINKVPATTCSSLGGSCCISPQTCPGTSLGTFSDCSGTCCSDPCQTPPADTCLDRGFYCCDSCMLGTEHPENDTDCSPQMCCEACLQTPPQEYNYSIIRTYFSPLIDGEPFDGAWRHAHSVTFSNPSRSDNIVEVRTLWDSDGIYFLYNVTDQQLESANQSYWKDDGAELYIDTGNDKSTGMDSNDYHFIINIYDLTQEPGIQSVTKHNPNSYTMEISIPWSAISSQPSFGMVMGLLLANNDRDSGMSSQFDWLDLIETGPYNRPNLWGDVLFTVRADSSRDGCVYMNELVPFIDSWTYDSTGYPMREMMGAVSLYYNPGFWC